jgi:alpha-D-ribose 1-methylphosphonate 5-triphosphate synthase subunit PhnG
MALVLPKAALADCGAVGDEPTRFDLTARADAFYFQVDGDEIPTSPKNDAGSATASVTTNNNGGSRSFAGAPYYGNTMETLPGTVNGVPGQFGADQLQIPFAQFPSYVTVNSTSDKNAAAEDGQYYRIAAEALPSAGTASAYYGAPPALSAPNQQQSATAETKSDGPNVITSALGSSQGIVTGPLEIANSTAVASISQAVGQAPKIEGKTFGRFSVAGQEFGFDQSGFTYLGQGQSSEDAIKQANEALKAANIQLALAPVVQEKTRSGGTRYTIGGLMVTTTQNSPSGAGKFVFTYIVGRATVSADVAALGFAASRGTESADKQSPAVPAFEADKVDATGAHSDNER